MSRFYGKVEGGKGVATRCGHHYLSAKSLSYEGCITVHMHVDKDGDNFVDIIAHSHPDKVGSQGYHRVTLYHGKVKALLDEPKTLIVRMAEQALAGQYAQLKEKPSDT